MKKGSIFGGFGGLWRPRFFSKRHFNMGARQSQQVSSTASDIAKNYGALLDSMMANQTGFSSVLREISNAEREWLTRFEEYVNRNSVDLGNEESLYRNIQSFMQLSDDDTKSLLGQIQDPGMRKGAESILERTNRAVVTQKYYEYKYLHLSAVFINFTDFVQKIFELLADASTQLAEQAARVSVEDVAKLLDAISRMIPDEDSGRIRQAVSSIQDANRRRIADMSDQLNKVLEITRREISDFPQRQLEEQREQGNAQMSLPQQDPPEAEAPSPDEPPQPEEPTENQEEQQQQQQQQEEEEMGDPESSQTPGYNRPQGQRPQGDRPRGDRFQGDRPRNDRQFGDRQQPPGERRPRPPGNNQAPRNLPDDAFAFGGSSPAVVKATKRVYDVVKGGKSRAKTRRP